MEANLLANFKSLRNLSWGLCLALFLGCGAGSGPTSEAVDASASLTSGLEALDQKNWSKADTDLSTAISSNLLTGDTFEEAMLARITARIEGGNLDGASADIQQMEQGAAAMDRVLASKAALLIKKGEAAQAKKVFAEARKLNRGIKAPTGI
jgi:Flp pilus assembly protein TadD